MNIIGPLLVLGIVIYGLHYMFGGEQAANRFARGTAKVARRGVERVGRGTGQAAMNYPLIAGIIVVVLVLSRC